MALLPEAKKRYRLSTLDCSVTSKPIHLIMPPTMAVNP
jgi:hypothetical protein